MKDLPVPAGPVKRVISAMFESPITDEEEKAQFERFMNQLESEEPSAALSRGDREVQGVGDLLKGAPPGPEKDEPVKVRPSDRSYAFDAETDSGSTNISRVEHGRGRGKRRGPQRDMSQEGADCPSAPRPKEAAARAAAQGEEEPSSVDASRDRDAEVKSEVGADAPPSSPDRGAEHSGPDKKSESLAYSASEVSWPDSIALCQAGQDRGGRPAERPESECGPAVPLGRHVP